MHWFVRASLRRLLPALLWTFALTAPRLAVAGASVSPTTSYNGSYTVSWTDASGGNTRAYLVWRLNGGAWSTRSTVTGTYSRAYSGMAVGAYDYKIQIYLYDMETRREGFDHETNVASVLVTSLSAPGVPGAVTAPASSSTGNYTVSWGTATGSVDRYELYEGSVLIYSGAALSVALTGRTDGTYGYAAQACNAAGCSARTAVASVSVLRVPGAPTISAPSLSGPDYTVSWTAGAGTVGSHEFQESPDSVAWASLSGSVLSVTGKPLGTTYYRVRACNSAGCSGYATASVTVTTYLSGPAQSSGTYTLSWSPRADQAQLDSRPAGGAFSVTYKGAGQTSFTFSPTADGVWEHRLRYCYPGEPGIPEVCEPYGAIFTVDVQLPPSTPGAMSATVNQTTGSYTVSWGASTGSSVGYWLEALNAAGTWVDAGGNPRTGLSFTASSVADGTYTHRVKACNRTCSAYAGPVSAAVLKVPSGVQGLTASVSQATGVIRLAWTAPASTVSRYVVTETGTLLGGAPRTRVLYATATTLDVPTQADGTFAYSVAAENGSGQGAPASTGALQMLRIPPAPSPIAAPPTSSGAHTITWTRPAGYQVDGYNLETSCGGGAWSSRTLGLVESYAEVRLVEGSTCSYRVAARNASGTGPTTATVSVAVSSLSLTEALPDDPVVQPDVPPQGWAGTVPGAPSTDGGAAGYRVDIEVPPGRAGMQPHLALAYSSRSGGGISGVGWSLSGTGSVYRCPQTLDQEGAGRAVLLDAGDRLCMNGVRLVLVSGVHGQADSEYRAELDPYDRVYLRGAGIDSWGSWFEVQNKSGRTSKYLAHRDYFPAGGPPPTTWLLQGEFDRQGNCIAYDHTMVTSRDGGREEEWVLSGIRYTGTVDAGGFCATSPASSTRSVDFEYTYDRPDKRTTYQYGAATLSTARLAAIVTRVGGVAVRRYDLAYRQSAATGRSLLDSVTLCAGATCGGEKLPPTKFSYQDTALATSPLVPVPAPDGIDASGIWDEYVIGDHDGDGRPDRYYVQFPYGGPRKLKLSTCVGAIPINAADSLKADPWLAQFRRGEGEVDVNYDGKTDVVGYNTAGYLAFGHLGCSNAIDQNPATPTNRFLWNPVPPNASLGARDYDGDGIPDIVVRVDEVVVTEHNDPDFPLPCKVYTPGPNATHKVLRGLSKDVPTYDDGTHIPLEQAQVIDSCNYVLGTSKIEQFKKDMNGDGRIDRVLDGSMTGEMGRPLISFQMGLDQLPMGWSPGIQDLGLQWLDVNGDGLPDIYSPLNGQVWVNRGGPPGSAIFQLRAVVLAPGVNAATAAINDFRRRNASFVLDFDSDGRDELLVPTTRVVTGLGEWCAGDPWAYQTTEALKFWCGDEFELPGANFGLDQSIFNWEAYRFRETSAGTFELVPVPAGFQAPINNPTRAVGDRFGRGLNDVYFRARLDKETKNGDPNPKVVGGFFYSFATRPYHAWSTSPAPDLMTSVANGLGATAAWTHQPLSQAAPPSGCDPGVAKPFYVAHHQDPRSPGYVFFTSSMWAVSKFEMSDGLGGMNPTCYRYEDAMLNTWGRGFQGFKKIIAEERLAPAAGEVAGVDGDCAGGSFCSANNLRTTTEFNQEFPFTNKVRSVRVELASDPVPAPANARPLSETRHVWQAIPILAKTSTTPGTYAVYSSGSVETKYDLRAPAGAQPLVVTTTLTEIDTASGGVKKSCVIGSDLATKAAFPTWPHPDFSQGFTLTQEVRTLSSDTAAWWLGRLDAGRKVSDFLPAAASASIPDLSAAPPTSSGVSPSLACPAFTETAEAKVQRQSYAWHDDTAPAGFRRRPSQTVLYSGDSATEESRTTYPAISGYDTYGNPKRREITARGVVGTLVTTYTTSPDGYFVATETNPANHVSTVVTDPGSGQPTYRQAVQGGPATTLQYDGLGRLLSTSSSGAQPVHERLAAGSATCGGAVVSRKRLQAGAPTHTEYLDCLGRVIWTETAGFDGGTIVSGEVERNARGAKVVEYATRVAGGTRYATRYSGLDALGRVGRKETDRAPAVFAAGRGEATLATDYTHQGFKTTIEVWKPVAQGGKLDMSRTYDGRGRLVETTQRVSSPTVHDIFMSYRYDPAGSLRHIVDSAGNDLSAAYDHLGRKTSVGDPDRGTWTYTWDGLSRLMTQRDANNTLLEQEYDGIGRPTFRFTTASGQATRMNDATWTYDTSRMGTLASVEGMGGGTTGDFKREYTYDALLRPEKVVTTVGTGAPDVTATGKRSFTVLHGYDRNHGRQKGMRYPDGEVVGYDFGPRGHLVGEWQVLADGARGKTYRQTTAMSPRGQVTGQVLGNAVHEDAQYDDSTGAALFLSATRPGVPANPLVRQTEYRYDHFLNLASQVKNVASVQSTETFGYDELQRLTGTARSWTGAMSGSEGDSYTYDDLGNITSKSDYGTSYVYGTSARATRNAGPHAVASVTKTAAAGGGTATFSYDVNGNQTSGDGRTITFDLMDRVAQVTQAASATSTAFAYAPDGGRYRQVVSGGAEAGKFGPKTTYYVDKDYEFSVWSGGTSEERTYIGAAVVYRSAGVREVRYQHLDRLGSLDAVTADDTAATELLKDAHGFDPWGKPRGREWAGSQERLHPNGDKPSEAVTTDRGFTGHEHLDVHRLIHMNGRVYDYSLGRFLSVDPIISNPTNPQSVNPYSYVGNNPLSGTDPTGYVEKKVEPMRSFADERWNAARGWEGGYRDAGTASTQSPSAAAASNGATGATSQTTSSAPASVNSPASENARPAQPAGTEPKGAAAERTDQDRRKLIEAQDEARKDPRFQPEQPKGPTHCNQATCNIAERVGAPSAPLKAPSLANEQAKDLRSSPLYREVDRAEAQQIANKGGLVIVAYEAKAGPGHTATVRPEGVPGDKPPAGGKGPLINDIGRSVTVRHENWAFPKGAELHYYTPRQP